MTSVDGNKGAGVDQNKRSHLADESEACWVIKKRVDAGALCGWISWTTPHIVCWRQSHCCVREQACRIVGMWGGGVLISDVAWEKVFVIIKMAVHNQQTNTLLFKIMHLSSQANLLHRILIHPVIKVA